MYKGNTEKNYRHVWQQIQTLKKPYKYLLLGVVRRKMASSAIETAVISLTCVKKRTKSLWIC